MNSNYHFLKNHGIKCLIGNDGMSNSMTTEWQNIYYCTHHMKRSPTALDCESIIQMIRNNYAYVNQLLNIKIGKIEKDYDADLLMIPYIPPTPNNIKRYIDCNRSCLFRLDFSP